MKPVDEMWLSIEELLGKGAADRIRRYIVHEYVDSDRGSRAIDREIGKALQKLDVDLWPDSDNGRVTIRLGYVEWAEGGAGRSVMLQDLIDSYIKHEIADPFASEDENEMLKLAEKFTAMAKQLEQASKRYKIAKQRAKAEIEQIRAANLANNNKNKGPNEDAEHRRSGGAPLL